MVFVDLNFENVTDFIQPIRKEPFDLLLRAIMSRVFRILQNADKNVHAL